MLDAGPRSVGALLGRILWSVQAGLVQAAAGTGIEPVIWKFTEDAPADAGAGSFGDRAGGGVRFVGGDLVPDIE